MKVLNLFGEYEEVSVGRMRSKIDMSKVATHEQQLPQEILLKIYENPDKKYYSISEVSKLFNVNTSLLRYWETKFKDLTPSKNEKGVRRYTKKDIETINKIHFFLKDKKWTISGTKKYIETDSNTETKKVLLSHLESIKQKLIGLSKEFEV